MVTICNPYISSSEKYFKNPNSFDPSRWETHEIDPYSFLPFGLGGRACIGRRAAEQGTYLTLIKIIQNYKIVYKGENPGTKIGLTLSPDCPLRLEFTKRK